VDIRNLSDAEIKQKINDAEEELFNLRFQSRVGRLDNPKRVRLLKKDIARMKTVLQEKNLNKQPAVTA
jgi:large subunit ribosomal protein L29